MIKAALARYPLSSSKARRKNRMKMLGTKSMTDPAPAIIPSASRDENQGESMFAVTISARRPKNISIIPMKGVAKANVSSNIPHIRARNMGIPRYLFVSTLSIISEPDIISTWLLLTSGRSLLMNS
ncbi:hypothetical protein DSECCO2_648760 [anaerobic digester metagenome]